MATERMDGLKLLSRRGKNNDVDFLIGDNTVHRHPFTPLAGIPEV